MARWLGSQPRAVYASQSRILLPAYRFVREMDRFKNLHADRSALLRQVRELVYDYYTRRWIHLTRILIDKENFEPSAFPEEDYGEFLRAVREILPDLKLLFLVRAPIPTVWSMMRRGWGHTLAAGEVRRYSLDECIRAWCASAELILEFADRPGVLVCQHERLVGGPKEESARILAFLGMEGGSGFEPRPTQEIGFSEDERAIITEATCALHEAVYAL